MRSKASDCEFDCTLLIGLVMKILMLPKSPDATMYFRNALPAKYLKEAGHEVRICFADQIPQIPGSGIKEADVAWADVVVFQRPASEFVLGVVKQIKEKIPGKLLLADYDDDYTAVPRWNPGYPFIKETEAYWRGVIPLMDGLLVSTPTLAESLAKLTKAPIRVIRNGFDFEMFDSLPPLTDPIDIIAPTLDANKQLQTMYSVKGDQWNEMVKDRTVIAWAGSRFHYSDLDILPEEMKEACARNDNIVFLFVGYLQGNIVPSVPVNRLFVTGGRSPIENFYQVMKSLKIDYLMAPLHANHFNASKCVVGGTLIPTRDGIFRIDEIVDGIGDNLVRPIDGKQVFTKDGLKPISAGFYKKQVPIVSVVTSDGYKISGTPDHRVMASSGQWIALGDLSVGDDVRLSGFGFSDRYVDVVYPYVAGRSEQGWGGSPEMLPKIKINERWGRLFGYLIGDGCIRGKNRISISGSTDYPDILDEAEALFRDMGLHPFRVPKKDKRQAGLSKGVDVVACSTHFIDWCRSLGVIGKKGEHGKSFHIPRFILRSPKSVVKNFLIGLFESDATVSKTSVVFCTKSIDLAREVQFVLLGFGIKSKVVPRWNQKYQKNYHYVVLGSKSARIYWNEIGFASTKKNDKLCLATAKCPSNAQLDWDLTDTIDSVEIGSGDVFDLTVPDGSNFVGNGFVNHNSNLKILEAMALKALPICSEFDPYMEDLRPSDPELLELWDEHEDEVYGQLVGYRRGDWARAFVDADSDMRDQKKTQHAKRANDMYCRMKHHAALRAPEYVAFFEEMLKTKGGV